MSDYKDHDTFVDAVKRMRQAQKDYVNHRQPQTLDLVKGLESQVDDLIFTYQHPSAYDNE